LIFVGIDEVAIGNVFCEHSGRSVAALIRVFGDIDVALSGGITWLAAATRPRLIVTRADC
jgi:hypothetical protein